ncbi:MAG: SiaC family regulatory phosphoprotein [Bacteroidota bacterium]
MKPLKLLETSDTPEVTLDKERGRFEFYGKIMPENPKEFFEPIIEWFKEYVNDPNPETILTFKLDYFNTAASKKFSSVRLNF